METQRIHVIQSSMQASDGLFGKKSDLRALAEVISEDPPLAIGFTEIAPPFSFLVKRRLKKSDYTLYRFNSIGLAVPRWASVLEVSRINILPPNKAKKKGSYRARGLLEVTVEAQDWSLVTFHLAHWITGAARNPIRRTSHDTMSGKVADRVKLNSKGKRISFWLGDTNDDEGNHKTALPAIFGAHRLVSIYDALGKYPDTAGKKTIDVIGHYEFDTRVTPVALKVYPKRKSDHKLVSAWYDLRLRSK